MEYNYRVLMNRGDYVVKERDPNRIKAFEIYKEHNGKISNREIANMLGINEKTVGSWKSKSKDDWNGVLQYGNGVLQEKTPKEWSTPDKLDEKGRRKVNRKKDGGVRLKPKGNPNPKNQFTVRNTAGKKHGLFMKYLPPGMHDLIDDIESSTVLDHLWSQITITFANILRSQEIIWVEDRYDIDKEATKTQQLINQEGDPAGVEKEYAVKFAYERQESLIKAQSRAMSEYRNLVKQYMALAGEDDERALKLQTMQADLDIKKANLAALTKENEGNDVNVVIVDEWRD